MPPNEPFSGFACERENLGSSSSGYELLHPLPGRCLCGHGTLRAVHNTVDVRNLSYGMTQILTTWMVLMQVRSGHAAENPGTSLPDDAV